LRIDDRKDKYNYLFHIIRNCIVYLFERDENNKFRHINRQAHRKIGTDKRDKFKNELRLDIMGETIKQARKERKLTQEQLGKLVGVKKAQISK